MKNALKSFKSAKDISKIAKGKGVFMAQGGLIAPNGKNSNLTEEQYKLVRTPKFKAWFGDWENDPQNASKVLDENGEPMVVYHATNNKYNKFSYDKASKGGGAYDNIGFYFTTYKQYKSSSPYGKIIKEVFLNLRNPFVTAKGFYEEKASKSLSKSQILQIIGDRKSIGYIDKEQLIKRITEKTKKINDNITFYEVYPIEVQLHWIWEAFFLYSSIEDFQKEVIKATKYDGSFIFNDSYYVAFLDNQIKLADGTNTTFDMNNPDIRFEEGGETNQKWYRKYKGDDPLAYNKEARTKYGSGIYFSSQPNSRFDGEKEIEVVVDYKNPKIYENTKTIPNRNFIKDWRKEHDEDEMNKFVDSLFDSGYDAIIVKHSDTFGDELIIRDRSLIKYGDDGTIESKFYNGLYIGNDGTYRKSNILKNGGNMELSIESKLSVSDIDHKYPNLPHYFINEQLIKGIEVEMEHTDNSQVARKIALDHLLENPFYYEYLDKMENELKSLDIDKHFQELQTENYYAKGGNLEAYEFNTPSGIESKLSYIQQVLVRTKAFKNWFGDWELAGRTYLMDGKQNFNKHYQNVSKVIDMETLEPKVGYHGTKEEEEFYSFATNKETGAGRPYGYFAENREYSMNFVGRSNLLYAAFLNIRNPFIARGANFTERKMDWIEASVAILSKMARDKFPYGGLEYNQEISKLSKVHESQIWGYLKKTYENENYNFWLLMARDFKSEFKNFIISHGYDGIFADEQFKDPYDKKDPSQFTNTFIVFDASQVKLADGRNLKFDPMSSDIRYEKGAQLDMPYEEGSAPQILSKGGKMRALLLEHKYKSGGALHNDEGVKDDAKEGGLFVGRSHANGGIKAYNVSTQQPIEVEGGEVIITKKAVDDNEKREFEGEMLTNKEILSRINESGGGVSFADGGEIHGCGCSGKKYNYGGETLEDYMIIKKMNDAYDMTLGKSVSYVNSLMNKLK